MLEGILEYPAAADERFFSLKGAQMTISTSWHINRSKEGFPPEREGWDLYRLQNNDYRIRSAASLACYRR